MRRLIILSILVLVGLITAWSSGVGASFTISPSSFPVSSEMYAADPDLNGDYRHVLYDLSLDIPSDTLMEMNLGHDYPLGIKVVGEDNIASDSLLQNFCLYSLDINFKVNQTNINPRSPSYRKLIDEVVPVLLGRQLTLHHIYVRMSASPEGPYGNNVRLANGRGQALLDSLARYMRMPDDDQIVVNVVPEDYALLYKRIERSRDPDRAAIMNAIDEHRGDDAATKTALRAIKGGSAWNRLLRDYYPDLRSARVVFYFTRYKLAEPEFGEEDLSMPLLPFFQTTPYFGSFDIRRKEPMLAVKTNLLYDAFFIPGMAYDPIVNIEVEYYPHNSNWSFLGEYEFPWWVNDEGMPDKPYPTSKHHYFQLLNGQLEARRYFTTDYSHTGHYLSLYGHAFLYDFCFDSSQGRGYQGEGWGAGLGYGYVKRLGSNPKSRWKLEAFLKWGFFETVYDPYYYGPKYDDKTKQFVSAKYYYDWHGDDVSKFIRRNHRFRSWFRYPTGVGITLSYDIFDRKLKY